MKAQVQAIVTKLEALREKAEELADSENERTASKYELVLEGINSALDALEEIDWEAGQ